MELKAPQHRKVKLIKQGLVRIALALSPGERLNKIRQKLHAMLGIWSSACLSSAVHCIAVFGVRAATPPGVKMTQV